MMSGLILLAAVWMSEPQVWTFEDPEVGILPTEWTETRTGEGRGSVWRIVNDSSQALAQTSSDGPRAMFNLCVLEEKHAKDLDLSVTVHALKGEIDRGGGPLWRYRDANNYYVCRWNPLENNFRVYKVVDGKRTQLATATVAAGDGEPHVIRITQQGNHIRCYLDGELRLEVQDGTFSEVGRIGLWTKADAVTAFDDLKVVVP